MARKDIHKEEVKKAMQYHHLKQVDEEMQPFSKMELQKNQDCR